MTTPPFADPIETVSILWHEGESKKIQACLCLYGEVGNYDGNTKTIAKRIGVDSDTVLKMGWAGETYRHVLDKDEDLAEQISNNLKYSHLWIIRKYRHEAVITWQAGMKYLRSAVAEKWSVLKLEGTIRKDFQLIVEPEFVDVVRTNITRLDRELVNTPLLGLTEQARDYVSEVIRPRAADLIEALKELEGMVD